MTKTYDIYSVMVRSTHSGTADGMTVKPPTIKWVEYSGHGCFKDAAIEKANDLIERGLTVAIKIATYPHSRKGIKPAISVRYERMN